MFFCKFNNNQEEIDRTLEEIKEYENDIGW